MDSALFWATGAARLGSKLPSCLYLRMDSTIAADAPGVSQRPWVCGDTV